MTDENVENSELVEEKSISETEKIPDSWIWIKNSNGDASMSATFATVAFFVTTILYILSAFQAIGPIELRPFDVGAASVYLTPVLMLYFGRRLTEKSSQ